MRKEKYPKIHTTIVRHFVFATMFCLVVFGLGTYALNLRQSMQNELYNSQLLLNTQAQHLNDELEGILAIADRMEQDSEIYHLVQNGITSQNYISADYNFNKILNKSYRKTDQEMIFSVNLITPQYMLGNSIPGISYEEARDFCFRYTGFDGPERTFVTQSFLYSDVFGVGEGAAEREQTHFFAVIKRMTFVSFQNRAGSAPPAILLILVESDLLQDTFEPLEKSTQGAYILTDQAGTSVFEQGKTPQTEAYLQADVADVQHANTLSGPYAGISGILPSVNWQIRFLIPTRQLRETVMSATVMPLLVILPVIGLLVAGYALALSRAVKQQVAVFDKALEQTGKGNFVSRIDLQETRYEETRLYALRFNEMTQKIQSLIRENYEGKLRSQEVEIMALNLQFNPHFLLNTLNVISWQLFHDEPRETDQTIRNLSKMIVYNIRNQNSLVPLQEDLEWTKAYVEVLKRRFGDKFVVFYDIPGTLFRYQVPKLFLQIFIENAVLHGFSEIDRQGLISIIGEECGDYIRFFVRDNGSGLNQEKYEWRRRSQDSHGLGISNITKRIELLFDSEGSVSIHNNEDCGVCVEIRFPKRSV